MLYCASKDHSSQQAQTLFEAAKAAAELWLYIRRKLMKEKIGSYALFAIILGLTGVVVIAIMTTLGPQIGAVFSNVTQGLSDDGDYDPPSSDPVVRPTAQRPVAKPTLVVPLPATGEESADEVPPELMPADNFFEDVGVNPFVDTSEDNLSTFALDVDTASYTVMRRYVEGGNLPPVSAVRVEEFVNYFEQGYEPPSDGGFAIEASGALSPFHSDGTHFLRVGIQGYRVPDEERKAASLTFVIDVSGSMDRENRLGLVKRSLQLLVDRLRPSDSVAIVVYGTQARMVLPPTSGEDRATILDAIYSLVPEGSTNAEAGLKLGYQSPTKPSCPMASTASSFAPTASQTWAQQEQTKS
jgi:Flp pilus assembly pilin Flp